MVADSLANSLDSASSEEGCGHSYYMIKADQFKVTSSVVGCLVCSWMQLTDTNVIGS
jgi:hypothetical protein